MSTQRMCFNIERPDYVNKKLQGDRGPFAPVLMALQTLVGINLWQLRQKRYPLLYKSGIYYKTEYPANEWHDIPSLLKDGYGDCKDLVAYRVAELQHRGVKCKPCIKWKFTDYPNPKNGQMMTILLIHVMVMYPNGKIEDPSALLGMKGEYQ